MSSVIRGSDNMDSADVEKGRAKAWVNFNGRITVSIRKSYNVSSITDNGSGDYTVNFTTPFSDADYIFSTMAGDSNGSFYWGGGPLAAPTVSAFRMPTGGGSKGDLDFICALFYQD